MGKISLYFILLISLLLTGCNFDNLEIDNFSYNQYQFHSPIFNNQLFEGICSLDEMNLFANNYQSGIVDVEHYNEAFFTSKSLIAFLLPEGSGGNTNKITSYTLEDGKLTINVKRTHAGDTCDEAYWLVFFELLKEEYSQVSNVFINRDGVAYELENVKTYKTKMPEEMPDDFWIFIWVTPFFEYDSRDNFLRDGYDNSSSPNITELVLEEEQLKEIYKLLRDIKIDMYPEAAFVSTNESSGGHISLSINSNGIQKSISLFETNTNFEDWICCMELGNTYNKIFDEYIKSSEAYKNLQLTKKIN